MPPPILVSPPVVGFAAKIAVPPDSLVLLANPLSHDMNALRPSLLPGLLAAVQRNRNRGAADVGLFEVGQAYRGDAPKACVYHGYPSRQPPPSSAVQGPF